MDKKYAVFPGYVTSMSDGEEHFIDGMTLCGLYGVNQRECVMVGNAHGYSTEYIESLIPLRPRSDGYYLLPSD